MSIFGQENLIAVNSKVSKTDTLFKIAMAAHHSGNFAQAKQLYEQVLLTNRNHFDALHLLGVLAYQMQDPLRSAQLISEALKINPNIYVALNNFSLALQAIGQLKEAVRVLNHSISLERNNPEAFFNLGNCLAGLGDYSNSFNAYSNTIKLNPNYAQAFNNRGNALQELNQLERALADYDEAIKINPRYDEAYANRGNILHELAKFDVALQSYEQAILINPDNAEAIWNKSLLLLLLGDYEKGLPLYEWRWRRQNTTSPIREFKAPLWLGNADLKEKVILIHGEQGLGDSIQFCRYIQLVSNLGARVILEDKRALQSIFSNLAGISEFIVCGDPLPHFDFHCPMLSLPLAFKSTYQTIPDPTPYIFADPEKIRYWQSRLDSQNRRRIGICWSSTSPFRYDGKRSMKLAEFIKLLPQGDFDFICLQKEIKQEDLEALNSRSDIIFLGNEINDFSDTAALIECVDEVISTCTSVPHLSAAMGKKTRILLSFVPDWRWGLYAQRTPFYKNVMLQRQTKINDWSTIKIAMDLNT